MPDSDVMLLLVELLAYEKEAYARVVMDFYNEKSLLLKTNGKMIRMIILGCILLLQVNINYAQTSLEAIHLEQGKFKVGFKHYTTYDSTRTYRRIDDFNNQTTARPIPISIWYPSTVSLANEKPIKVLRYFEILKEEEEWENLPNEQLLNWFNYFNTPTNQNHLKESTHAYANIEFANGKYPIVTYAPGHQYSSIENFALCEYLASHGYVVISSPSRGTETLWFSNNNAMEIETQARDVEFLMKEATKITNADPDQIAAMGFSFGGLANIIAQTRNENIKAVVSLDGTERYQYALLEQSAFFDVAKIEVPYLHMAQKDIPEQVLKEDNIDAELNTRFELYDSIYRNRAYKLKFNTLSHSQFSTLGVLFEKRDERQDKSDAEIMESYRLVSRYTLNFLNAYLKDESVALGFIENEPTENGIENGLVTYSSKQPEQERFTFQDFNESALQQGYQNVHALYLTTLEKNPKLELPEGNLNTLGLQLVFKPGTSEGGINILEFATRMYPESANLFDSLAEAHLFLGNKEKAKTNFKKSLELNPQNQNAVDRLEMFEE